MSAISAVTFDPIPLECEKDEVPKFDPMKHPIYSRPIPVKYEYFDRCLAGWMHYRLCGQQEEDASEATQEAWRTGQASQQCEESVYYFQPGIRSVNVESSYNSHQ